MVQKSKVRYRMARCSTEWQANPNMGMCEHLPNVATVALSTLSSAGAVVRYSSCFGGLVKPLGRLGPSMLAPTGTTASRPPLLLDTWSLSPVTNADTAASSWV